MEQYEKRGYLRDDYRIFHLTDRARRSFAFHYHDFYKVLVLLQGRVNYCVEGRSFSLEPNDVVLISEGELHHPEVLDDSPYERIILYLSPEFLRRYQEEADLLRCFREAREHGSNVLRLPEGERSRLLQAVQELVRVSEGFGGALYRRAKLLEFLILLNRAVTDRDTRYIPQQPQSDGRIMPVLQYINQNLSQPMTVESLSQQFYISRYHLMHLFRSETGYTLLGYITEKRLHLSRQLLRQGRSVTQACYEAGFTNYSSFLRAFKKRYGALPRQAE